MIINTESIHHNIESLVRNDKLDYIDAILHYCNLNGLDVETIGSIISLDQNLTAKVQEEAENLHYLKKISRLPI